MPIPFATSEVVTAVELNELARTHWRKTTAKQVVNTVTETDLLNAEITIDAGAMSTNRMLRLTAWGDGVNNTGAAVGTPRLKLKLGATTLLDTNTAAVAWATSANRGAWRVIAEIQNLGATNSQWSNIHWVFHDTFTTVNALFTTGTGLTQSQNNILAAMGGNATAVDTTAALALVLTVTLATANTLEDVTLKAASVEIV